MAKKSKLRRELAAKAHQERARNHVFGGPGSSNKEQSDDTASEKSRAEANKDQPQMDQGVRDPRSYRGNPVANPQAGVPPLYPPSLTGNAHLSAQSSHHQSVYVPVQIPDAVPGLNGELGQGIHGDGGGAHFRDINTRPINAPCYNANLGAFFSSHPSPLPGGMGGPPMPKPVPLNQTVDYSFFPNGSTYSRQRNLSRHDDRPGPSRSCDERRGRHRERSYKREPDTRTEDEIVSGRDLNKRVSQKADKERRQRDLEKKLRSQQEEEEREAKEQQMKRWKEQVMNEHSASTIPWERMDTDSDEEQICSRPYTEPSAKALKKALSRHTADNLPQPQTKRARSESPPSSPSSHESKSSSGSDSESGRSSPSKHSDDGEDKDEAAGPEAASPQRNENDENFNFEACDTANKPVTPGTPMATDIGLINTQRGLQINQSRHCNYTLNDREVAELAQSFEFLLKKHPPKTIHADESDIMSPLERIRGRDIPHVISQLNAKHDGVRSVSSEARSQLWQALIELKEKEFQGVHRFALEIQSCEIKAHHRSMLELIDRAMGDLPELNHEYFVCKMLAYLSEGDITPDKYEKVSNLYNKYMKTYEDAIQNIQTKRFAPSSKITIPPGTDKLLCDLIIYQARLYVDHGDFAPVIATIQALVEFHFFIPVELEERAHVMKFGTFERFWKSLEPRIGEKGSKTFMIWFNEKNSFSLEKPSVKRERYSEAEAQLIKAEYVKASKCCRRIPDTLHDRKSNHFIAMEKACQSVFWRPLKSDEHSIDSLKPVAPASSDIFPDSDGESGCEDGIAEDFCVSVSPFEVAKPSVQNTCISATFLQRYISADSVQPALNAIQRPIRVAVEGREGVLKREYIISMREYWKNVKYLIFELLQCLGLKVDGLGSHSTETWFSTILSNVNQSAMKPKLIGFFAFITHLFLRLLTSRFCDFKLQLVSTFTNFIADYYDRPEKKGFYPAFRQELDSFCADSDFNLSKEVLDVINVKLFEIELRIENFCNGFYALDHTAKLLAHDSERIRNGIRFVYTRKAYDVQRVQARTTILYALLTLVRHFDSVRTMDGKLKKDPPFMSKARILYLWCSDQHSLRKLFDTNFSLLDLEVMESTFRRIYESYPYDKEEPPQHALCNPKALALQLYAIAFWENRGISLFQFLCHLGNIHRLEEKQQKEKKLKKPVKIELPAALLRPGGKSIVHPFSKEAIDFVEQDVDAMIARLAMTQPFFECSKYVRFYRILVEMALKVIPFHPDLWRHALTLSSLRPRFVPLLKEETLVTRTLRMETLFTVIRAAQAWQDAMLLNLPEHVDVHPEDSYIRLLLTNVAKLALKLPYLDTYSVRLALNLKILDWPEDHKANERVFADFGRKCANSKPAILDFLRIKSDRKLLQESCRWFVDWDNVPGEETPPVVQSFDA